MKTAYDEAAMTLANILETKAVLCQDIAESSSETFERELKEWIRANGTVSSSLFDTQSGRMMEKKLAGYQETMKSVDEEQYEAHVNNARNMMEVK